MKYAVVFGLLTLSTLIMSTLKLLGRIDWSWGWILAPIWGQVLLLLAMIVCYAWYDKYREDL